MRMRAESRSKPGAHLDGHPVAGEVLAHEQLKRLSLQPLSVTDSRRYSLYSIDRTRCWEVDSHS
jgi:hypothetical protein